MVHHSAGAGGSVTRVTVDDLDDTIQSAGTIAPGNKEKARCDISQRAVYEVIQQRPGRLRYGLTSHVTITLYRHRLSVFQSGANFQSFARLRSITSVIRWGAVNNLTCSTLPSSDTISSIVLVSVLHPATVGRGSSSESTICGGRTSPIPIGINDV